jgi:hypothetical protein
MNGLSEWIASDITQSEYRHIDTPSHPDALAVLEFWRDRPADGLRIGRDIPSRAVSHWLSHMVVNEPVDGGPDFRIHLAGEGLRVRFGRDITGERMTRLHGAEAFLARSADMCAVLETGEPRLAQVNYHAGHVEVLKLELAMFPVMAPNGIDRWVLTFVFYF